MTTSHVLFKDPTQLYFDSKPVADRLLKLFMKTGYNCTQKNGQRLYGPKPDWTGPPPEKGSEVFVGRLPRDCFEDELVPVFDSIAPIYELRMMMNFTGFNRGFAFITYCNPHDAWQAVITLNNYEIRPGHQIGVSKSVDNCRLYIGGIPTDKNRNDAWEELSKVIPTVKEIIMYPNPEDRTKNRGFFFAEFDSHRTAAMAKRMMIPGTTRLWNQDVIVDWADPEPDVNPNIMATITKLFIRNLTSSITIDNLRRILENCVTPGSIQRIYVAGHYGFVHFDNRTNAQRAKEKLSMVVVDGEYLEVQWARPKCFKKHNANSGSCRSLPPRTRNGNTVQTPEQNNNNKVTFPYIHVSHVAPMVHAYPHYAYCE